MTKQLTIQTLRDSVKNHSYIKHEFPDADYTQEEIYNQEDFSAEDAKIIDIQTANVLIKVYNTMKEQKNKEKFERMLKTWNGFEKLIDFAWKCVK